MKDDLSKTSKRWRISATFKNLEVDGDEISITVTRTYLIPLTGINVEARVLDYFADTAAEMLDAEDENGVECTSINVEAL